MLDKILKNDIIYGMDNKIESIISQNLIELRKNKNLKQSELSEAIGYSDKTISRWENGTSIPDIATLVKLAEFYNVTINDIIIERAVDKISTDKPEKQTKKIKDLSNLFLAILTIWLLAVMVYVGMVIFGKTPLWQIFVFAIPISSYLSYRHTSRYFNIKWLDFSLLTIVNFGLITAIYLLILDYNFWQLFFLSVPLEGMCLVNTFFRKKPIKRFWNRNKND